MFFKGGDIHGGKKIGTVTNFFKKINVVGFKTEETIIVGDKLRFLGKGGKINITLAVESMQKEHAPIQEAKPGDEIGIKVPENVKVPEGCCVFKI